jgi:hypothetical protein
MSPYEILGVSPNATDAEIKLAYRKLVKKFHPDVNKDQHEGMIKLVNEAYDILSDPTRKAQYDARGTESTFEYEEDPREVYRREYIARKVAEGRQKRAEYDRMVRAVYKVLRLIAFPALIFASLLVTDRYLPQHEYHEAAEYGWQKRLGKIRHRPGELFSFMKTKHFVIAVPDEIHIDYDYDATDKQILTIAVSPIFKIPSTVSLIKDGQYYSADIKRTIFSNRFNLHYILLITSLIVVLRKNGSDFNLSIALFPILLLFFIWLLFF